MRIGIDIGGTKTAAVVVGPDGRVRHEVRLQTGFGGDAVLATVARAVAELSSSAALAVTDFDSVGIGIPGAVDADTGRVSHAVNLGLEDLPLASLVEAELGRPVRVENDVKAAALGVHHALAEEGPLHSMAYLNLGTGLAAGLVVGGRLWRGSRGVAGEIGHIPVDPGGDACPCGQRGCLELVASGSAVVRMWPTDDPHPARALFAAADAGDRDAADVRARFVASVAASVRILVLTIDVDVVVIGGGLSNLGDPLLAAVRDALGRQAAASPFLAMQDLASRVRLVPRGFPAAAVGATLVGAPVAGEVARAEGVAAVRVPGEGQGPWRR